MFANRIYLVVFISDSLRAPFHPFLKSRKKRVLFQRKQEDHDEYYFFFFSIGEKFVATRNESEGRGDVY